MRKHDTRRVTLKRAMDKHPVTATDGIDAAGDANRLPGEPPLAIERQFHQDLPAKPAELDHQCFE